MLAGREPERHRSVLVAPWVKGSVPTNGQTGAIGEMVDGDQQRCRVDLMGSGAGDADGVGGGATYRVGATGRTGEERFGVASDHLSPVGLWPHRLAALHAPSDADTEPARLRTRGELAHQARVADSRLTRDQHYDRTRLGRDVQRPLGEPSRPRGQPTSDPSPAPMSPYSRTRPGCHDTQASLRLVGRATADSWRTAVARAARCPGVPLRRRGLSIDDRLSVDMQRQRPLPRTRPRTEHRRAGIRKPAG